MLGRYIHVWLFLFGKGMAGVTVWTGLYSRVELNGEKFEQHTADSLKTVEWNKQNKLLKCLCFILNKQNNTNTTYSACCGAARFSLDKNSLVLENVTAASEGVFTETVVYVNETLKQLHNFTLHISYPPNATGISVSVNSTSVSLKCEVMSSFTHLKWKRGDSLIQEDDRHSFSERNQSLHISNRNCSDCGTYSCVATNEHGHSDTRTDMKKYCMQCETSSDSNNKIIDRLSVRIMFITGFTIIAALGLFIIIFCCVYRCQHSQRRENGRNTEGDVNIGRGIYEEIPDTEQVTPLPYVYTDFIRMRRANQNPAAVEPLEDFGYSEIGPASRENTLVLDLNSSDEESRPCTSSGE